MITDAIALGAEAWVLAAVAGAGIAVLPWSSPEIGRVRAALGAAARLLQVRVRVRRARAGASPAGLAPAGLAPAALAPAALAPAVAR